MPETPVVLVGLGRVGGSIARALAAQGRAVFGFTRHRRRVQGVRVLRLYRAALPPGATVLLAVPDRAVAEVALALAPYLRRGHLVAHVAGALTLDVLAPAAAAGAAIGSLHPLAAVPSNRTPLAGHAAALAGAPAVRRRLGTLCSALGLVPISVDDAQRARYHAAAALTANGLMALLSLSAGLLEAAGPSRAEALAALIPLAASALEGVALHGLPAALTGPVARGDAAVVRAHLAALRGDEAWSTYRALSEVLVGLAEARGGVPADGLAEIRTALRAR